MELRYCEKCGDVTRVEGGGPMLSAPYVCERCKKGADGNPCSGKKDGGSVDGATPGSLLKTEALDLFSDQSMALALERKHNRGETPGSRSRRSPQVTPSATTTRTPNDTVKVAPGSGAPPPSAPLPLAQEGKKDSAMPSTAPGRILFRCPHCRASLSVRPVNRTSKLVCPKCTQSTHVTSSGTLLRSSASAVPRKGGSGEGKKPGSTIRGQQAKALPTRSPIARKSALQPPSSKNLPVSKPDSVRLLSVNPKALESPNPEAPRKPTSAFQEHRERRDPSKTVFLTETPTRNLQKAPTVTGAPDPGDLLSAATDGASAAARYTDRDLKNAPSRQTRQQSLLVRILKALFTP